MTLGARSRVKILIVEDSPTQAQQLRLILESNGYGISVAASRLTQAVSRISECVFTTA